MRPCEHIETIPGTKFPGDRIVLFRGVHIRMREQAELARRVAHNEALRKKRDPSVSHWSRDAYEYFGDFMRDVILAPTWDDFAQVCKRYGLTEE